MAPINYTDFADFTHHNQKNMSINYSQDYTMPKKHFKLDIKILYLTEILLM